MTEERLATLFLRMPDEVKQRLKMLAVTRHTTIAEIVRQLIDRELARACRG